MFEDRNLVIRSLRPKSKNDMQRNGQYKRNNKGLCDKIWTLLTDRDIRICLNGQQNISIIYTNISIPRKSNNTEQKCFLC